jgi:hypothetical protein
VNDLNRKKEKVTDKERPEIRRGNTNVTCKSQGKDEKGRKYINGRDTENKRKKKRERTIKPN